MSADVLAWRRKFGVVGPSTNTVVQPEFDVMRPPGVTNHYSRIYTTNAQAVSDESFIAGTTKISDGILDAIRSVLTCEPDHLIMGMSAINFYGGTAGARAFKQTVRAAAGIGVCTGAESIVAALHAIPGIRSVAFLSPYFPVANAEVRRFLTESGFAVREDVCLRCSSWTDIAKVPSAVLRETAGRLASGDADAIVQVGTNLCMAALADELESALDRPIIAINTATYWHALRTNGIDDKISGFGRLLRDY